MTPHARPGRSFLVCALAVASAIGASIASPPSRAGPPAVGESGIELIGRSADDAPPAHWSIVDKATEKPVATIANAWGFTPVRPGTYGLRLLPSGEHAVEVDWGSVAVEEGRVARVAVDSGVDVVGRGDRDEPLEHWEVIDKATGKAVAHTRWRWGFTPLRPGSYELRLLPSGEHALEVSWGAVAVEAGRVARVAVGSGIDVVGRDATDDPPAQWEAVDKVTGKAIAHTLWRWGFTPLPPGSYEIRLLPKGEHALEVSWGTVAVETGRVARVAVGSGIDVVGRDAADDPPDHWDAIEKATGKPAAHSKWRWGFTPLLPGAYELRVLPTGDHAIEVSWGSVVVEEGHVARVAVSSGIEVRGRNDADDPPDHWDAIDRATGRVIAHSQWRWGFTPLPAGTYAVRVLPRGDGAIEIPWTDVEVASAGVVSLKLSSGIDLTPIAGQEPPEVWSVLESATRAPVARVRGRWGFTPLPAGAYVIERGPLRWDVRVEPGQVLAVGELPLAGRLAKATGAGRPTEKQRDPEGYRRLEEHIEIAIRKAAAWLKTQPIVEQMRVEDRTDYPTIGVLALVHSGELERDPALARRCRDFLLRRPLDATNGTYATSLTAMALRDTGAARNQSRILECAAWLVENQGLGDARKGWGYGDPVPGFEGAKPVTDRPAVRPKDAPRVKEIVRRGLVVSPSSQWDLSNLQFAVLGLHAAAESRITIPRECWARVESQLHELRRPSEGWGYQGGNVTGSMTCAGVASLLVARHHLEEDRASADPAVVGGLEWLSDHFTLEENPGSETDHYYFLYGLERVGVLAGTEFYGEHEWYPLGARRLLRLQLADGSWHSEKSPPTGHDHDYLDTCYAILFLRRSTLPLDSEAPAALAVTFDEAALRRDLSPSVELILDCSGSMKDPVEGRPKIEIARSVLTETLDALPSDIQVGLRLYGHRYVWVDRGVDPRAPALDPNDPRVKQDTELVVPIGPLDAGRRADLARRIASARPLGWTPMVHSLLEAKRDFTSGKGARAVVLVSDGEETGGGKLEDVAAAYRGAGIDVKIHVVGFDIAGTDAERQLREIARIGGGQFFGVRNARELSSALRSVVPAFGFEALGPDGKVVLRGALNADPAEIKAGTYRVRLVGVESEPATISLGSGDEVTLTVDAAGKLTPLRR